MSAPPREHRPMWRRYLRFRGADVRADVDEEIAFHIDLVATSLIAAGESPDAAWRSARAEFGDVGRATTECYRIGQRRSRRAERAELFAALGQDLRYSLRSLRATPLFTLGVIAMMALAFAATTAMFSLVDAMFIQPPSLLRDASSVHRIYETGRSFTGVLGPSVSMSYGRFDDLRRNMRAFSDVAAYSERETVVEADKHAQMGHVVTASASLWSLFGVKAALGRVWTANDEPPSGGTFVTVLAYDFWYDAFDADSTIIGRSVVLGAKAYRVIGVAPQGFSAFSRQPVAAFVPLRMQPGEVSAANEQRPAMRYASSWLSVVVRQRNGWSDAAARRDLERAEALSQRVERSVADSALRAAIDGPALQAILAPVLRERGPLRTDQGRVVLWLGGFSVFVLVVAALNVANLLRARLRRRQREIAIRLALGATLARLLRLLFVESALLTAVAAIAGVGLVALLGDAVSMVLLPGSDLPRFGAGVRAAAFTSGLTIIVASVTALAAVVHVHRWTLRSAIAESGHAGDSGRRRVRGLSLAVQGALALSLCTTAGLFLKSLRNVRALPLGYDATGVVVVAPTSIANLEERARLFDTLVTVLGQRFDRRNVARSFTLPFASLARRTVRLVDGDTLFARQESILYNPVSSS
jgi:predicted permease